MTKTTIRDAGLRQLLCERRREIEDEVQRRKRGGRTDRPVDGGDNLEHSDADIQVELEFALLQMKAETLTRIDEAVVRIDAGRYGFCFECASEIPIRRLRALPFALRCQPCEEGREVAQGRAQQLAQRRDSFSLFPDAYGL